MKDYTNIVNRAKNRKKEEEGTASSSSKKFFDATNTVEKAKLRKRINFDTFESDLSNTSSSLSSIIGGWQTQETMANTRSAIESMYNRTNDYQTYISKYQPDTQHNLGEISKYYKTALDNWDNLSELYGYYKDADSYSTAMRKLELDKQYTGKTYEEIQEEKKKYEADSDVYKYLDSFTGYSNLKDFDKALESVPEDYASALKTARNTYALDHKFDLYADLMQNEDFAELSQYKPTATRSGIWKALAFDGSDETYEYINDVDGARQKLINKYKEGNGATELETHGYEYMTDDERAVFNYLYAQDKDKAYDYLDDMAVTLSKRLHDKSTAKWEEMADGGALASLGLSLATPIYTMAGGIGNVLASADELITGKEYNPYAPLRTPSNASTDIRKYVGENIAESTEGMEIFGQNIPSFLYQTGMSIGDTALGASAFGVGFTGIMGSNAFQQTAREMKEAGADADTVIKMGMASGIAEAVFEYVSIDKLLTIKNADGWKNIVKSALKQAGIEATEEMATEGANILSDLWFRQDESELKKMAQDLRDRGYSESEISAEIRNKVISQIGWAGAGGALSGLGMGGAMSANQYHGLKNTGNQIMNNETTGELMDFAGSFTDKESETYKLYTEYANMGFNEENITPARLGNLYHTLEGDVVNEFNTANRSDVLRSYANKANELGDSRNSGLIASAVQKKKDGQRLSHEERKALNTDAGQAIMEHGAKINHSKEFDDAYTKIKRANFVIEPKTEDDKARIRAMKELKQGEKTVNAEGNEVTIEGIRTEDGATTILTSQGEVSADEMTFSSTDAEIVSYAQNMSTEKADLFIKQYDGKSNVDDYATSFNLAYSYGEGKFDLSVALKNRGVLTEAQALKAYEAGNIGRAIEKQKVVDEINKKYSGKTFVKGKFDDSILREGDNMARISESKTRQNAINFLRAFSEVTGVNVTLMSSTVDEKGVRRGANGKYDPDTNTVYIDIFAGSMDATVLNDTIIPTLSHEVTHWMKQKAPAMYQKMQDFTLEFLVESSNGKITLNQLIEQEKLRIKRNHPKQKVTDEDAIDELVARTCSDMLANSDKVRKMLAKMSEAEQKTFIAKVKETFENIMNWVNDLLKQYQSNSKEAELLRQYKARMKELSKMWDKALEEAIQTNQSMEQMKAEGFTNDKINEALNGNGISKDGTTIIGKNVAQMDERTYREGGRDFLENWLNQKVEAGEMDGYDADNILIQTDLLYDLMQEIKAENDLPDYAKWAETDATYNEDGEQVTVIVKNGDYTMNLDSSQVCKKRTALNAVLNAMVQSSDLSAYTLTEKDVAILNDIIKKHDFEIACALCFVDSKRYRVGEWAESFCEGVHTKKDNKYGFNEMVRSLVPEGSDIQIDEFNFTGRKLKNPKKNLLKNAPDSKLDFTLIDQIMAENASNTAQYRYAKAIKENKELRSILNPSEIISSIGLDNLRVKNMKLYSLVNGHQGTAKPKFAHDSVAFGNDILKATSWTADKAKYVGGVRLQSFSDFMANMVFDYVQMISELSARELTSHAYTKEPLFVRLFGLTGMKINMSLVPRVFLTDEQKARFAKLSDKKKKTDAEYLEAKEHAGLYLDENGEWQYAWEDETFPYDVAMDIMADARYTKNCGTIAVGISNLHIEKLLADDRISMVIPYHKSGLNHTVAIMRNIDLYNDYTDSQNTRGANGKKLDGVPDFDFYGDLYGKDGKEGTHDPRQTAENYKKWCAENGYIPKFDQFKDNPNYYKLLIDFTVYDINDSMKYTEQEAVKPIYPSREEFKELILKGVVKNGVTYGGLEQSQETSDKLKAETDAIISEFKKALTSEYGEDVLGTQYSDRDYMEAVNRGDMETAQKMVDEVAGRAFANSVVRDNNGKLLKVYHGSPENFTVFKGKEIGGLGNYFSPWESFAQMYGETHAYYVNLENPIEYDEDFEQTNDVEEDEADGFIYIIDDIKGKIDQKHTGDTEIVVFDSNRIKSADPVTYDDQGNVIPLSERFNTENDDIRYSDRDIDSWLDSLDADDLLNLFWGDTTEATSTETPKKQRRVDEVKKRLDAIGLSFTGTKNLAFTDERIEQYLREFGASNPNYAQAYIAYMTPQQYLNLTMGSRTYTVDRIENESASYGEIDFEKLGNNGAMFLRIEEGKNKAEVTGHEGRHRMLLLGKAGFEKIPVLLFDYTTKYNKTAKDSLKLTPQVFFEDDFISKTRGTVVHDLVPLSSGNKDLIIQKFGSGTEADVYYADRDYTSVYELMGEKDTLDEENRKLKADIEKLKATIGLEDVKITRFRSLADYLKKQAGSNYSREALGDALKELYTYIQTTENLKWYNVMAKAEEIANEMMQLNVPVNYFREVMNDIRQDRVSLSEEQYAEAVKLYGSYGNLHKALFGSVNLAKSGRPLEAQWKDWSKAFPTVFKADISATDMVKELRDIVDALKSTSAVMGEYERQEAIRHLGMEIYNQFWNIASDSSEAVRKEKVAHRQMMEEMRKNYQKRQAEKTLHPEGELALKYEKLLKDTIKRDRNEMKRIRELGNKRMEAHKERAEKNALIQRITTKSLTLNKWLNDNSKNSHVPEPMKPIVRNFLNAIDFSSKKMLERGWGTQRDADLAKALSKVHRMMLNSNSAFTSDDGSNYVGAYFPKGFVEKIGEVVERLEDSMPIADEYILNRMSVEDLRSLDMLVSVLKGSVMDMNKFVATQHKEGIANLSQDGMAYRDKLGTAKEYADWRQWVQKTLNWNNVNPFFAFKRFGEDGKKIFDAFRDGWDKFAFNVNEIIDYAKASYTKKEIKEWRKEIKRDIEISGNRKVTMTIPQIMSVYCLQKREQARKHLLGKGIRVGDIKDGKNVIRQTEGTGQLTQNDIDIIIGNLTVRQKEVADRLQEFMNTVARRWGNEVTMRLHYYLGFEEENYFPIKTDDNYNANNPTDNENDLFRLLNMSFTKSINENANNKIMALDIFDVFAQHTSDMAKYNALALPVYDAFRWYSYKENTDDNAYSVKASLEKAFGKDAKNYIYTFIKDINGIQNVGRDALGTKFFSNAKIASVGANLKVIALQPTSYARAYAVIDAKYLIPALASKVQYETVIVDGKPKKRLLAEKYCGIVQWKTLGFYDTNIQRGVADLIKHEQTWKDMIVEASMKGAGKADELTLGKLWNACEAEVKDKQKNLSVGSEEFYKAVALRLRDVVYNTQVVDSTMTRSQMMRSGDKWDKVTSAFMSEPTLSYNMLQDAYMDYKLAVRETGSKTEALSKHRNKIARVITAYVVTNIFTALLEAGFVGFRDDDEEKMTTEEFMAQLWSNFLSNMSLLGKIPYVKDVISIFQGYSSGRMDTQWAEYAYYSVNGIKKMLEGKGGNPYQMAKNAVRAFSYVSGLPFYNLNRDLKATLDSLGIVSTEELEEMFNEVIGGTYPSLKIK